MQTTQAIEAASDRAFNIQLAAHTAGPTLEQKAREHELTQEIADRLQDIDWIEDAIIDLESDSGLCNDIAKLVLARRRGERIEAEKLLHGICFTVAEKVEARARKDAEAGL